MMKIISVSILFFLISCNALSQDLKSQTNKDLFKGIWVFENFENEIKEYKKANSFDENEPGIAFKNKSKIVVRTRVGSCGTPPYTYENYNGTWKVEKDSIIILNYEFWDGELKETLTLKEISNSKLVLQRNRIQRVKKE